jgi:hypothetical protein
MQNMLLSHSIYDGKNLKKIDGGFEQHIRDENVDIFYKVDLNTVQFRDKKNDIIFKMRDTDE